MYLLEAWSEPISHWQVLWALIPYCYSREDLKAIFNLVLQLETSGCVIITQILISLSRIIPDNIKIKTLMLFEYTNRQTLLFNRALQFFLWKTTSITDHWFWLHPEYHPVLVWNFYLANGHANGIKIIFEHMTKSFSLY